MNLMSPKQTILEKWATFASNQLAFAELGSDPDSDDASFLSVESIRSVDPVSVSAVQIDPASIDPASIDPVSINTATLNTVNIDTAHTAHIDTAHIDTVNNDAVNNDTMNSDTAHIDTMNNDTGVTVLPSPEFNLSDEQQGTSDLAIQVATSYQKTTPIKPVKQAHTRFCCHRRSKRRKAPEAPHKPTYRQSMPN